MITTLNKIRTYQPCENGWKTLLTNLGKTKGDDEPLSIATILDSNGLDDAIWCLRAVEGGDREIRLFAVWCARQVQHLMTDSRSLAALDVAERYANKEASDAELISAWEDAWDAAVDAANAAAADASRAANAAAASAATAAAADASRAANAARDASWAHESSWGASCRTAREAQAARLRDVLLACRTAREAQAARLREVCADIGRGEK